MESNFVNYWSDASLDTLSRIDFNVLSNKFVLNSSAISDDAGITINEISYLGEPVEGGVADKRLGVTGRNSCSTCGHSSEQCPGHSGHVALVKPVFHIGYLDVLKQILSFVCLKCRKLLINQNSAQYKALLNSSDTGKNKFIKLKKMLKNVKTCFNEEQNCTYPVHKIVNENKLASILLLAEQVKTNADANDKKKKQSKILTPQACYDILSSISPEIYEIMGFNVSKNDMKDLIIKNLPIAPVCIRPSIKLDTLSSTVDDDASHKYVDIIKHNEELKKIKGSTNKIDNGNNDEFTFLQYHCCTLIMNNKVGVPKSLQKNRKETKSLTDRMKGKEGRIRGNMIGKRVNMSLRTVIVPDPTININEVGVPLNLAKQNTYPEYVTSKNLGAMTELVYNGPNKYPGALAILRTEYDELGNQTEREFRLDKNRSPPQLMLGDKVERHLMNGDYGLYNRQPSLHKTSMMGHKIKIIEDPDIFTFRMNESVTEPYNADFDGDEMNLHIPQTEQVKTELMLIANAKNQFIDPATSKITIKPRLDSLVGSYLMTTDGVSIPWEMAVSIVSYTSIGANNTFSKGTMISGRELFSQILPRDFSYTKKNENGDITLQILNGQIIIGTLDGSELNNIVHRSWYRYGPDITRKLLDDIQLLALSFLSVYGFTISIKDIIVSKDIKSSVKNIIETKRKEAFQKLTEYENDPYVMTYDAYETDSRESLRAIQDEIQKTITASFEKNNNFYIAISSGASGGPLNAGQIIGCIGQVTIDNSRIKVKYDNRTLPLFPKFDDGAFSRGFCSSSFLDGLSPIEYFYQTAAGREGVINTAIKTASTGYVQRRLAKIMEDIKIEYDGTVRNSNNKIIQFVYGDNGIHTQKQCFQTIGILSANNQKIIDKYVFDDKEIKKYSGFKSLNDSLYNKIISLRNKMRKAQKFWSNNVHEFKVNYAMPMDLNQFIYSIINRPNRNGKIVDPETVLKYVTGMYNNVRSNVLKFTDTNNIKKKDNKYCKILLKTYLFDVLSPKRVINEYKLTLEELEEVENFYFKNIINSKAEPGEMVGISSAQSIGEPVTQANLKSFQKAGTGFTGTQGLDRINELLSISKNIKIPITNVYLEKQFRKEKKTAEFILSNLKYITLEKILEKGEIIFDPNPGSDNSISTIDGVDNLFNSTKENTKAIKYMPWVIRLVLSKEKLIMNSVTLLDIKLGIQHNWDNRFNFASKKFKKEKKYIEKITKMAIMTNYDNSEIPVVHVRFDSKNYSLDTLIGFQEAVITKFDIKGIEGLINTNRLTEEKFKYFDDDGNIMEDKQFLLQTQGINLSELALIKGIDMSETYCNDIPTIYETYGVEAARTVFIKEFSIAVESSGSGGASTNFQHVELLADCVTHLGTLIPVNRHGAVKLDTDPLSKASFEKPVDQLIASSVFCESDHLRSVSSRIMTGMIVNGGTGSFNLLVDHNKIMSELKNRKKKPIKSVIKGRLNIIKEIVDKKN